MNNVTKVFKTNDDTILIVTATTKGCNNRNYVSVTANEIKPILRSDAINCVRESLEDGELWRMAVSANQTELGLEDWVEMVIDNDGELSGFDNSLYDTELNIDGEEYLFDSLSCGCLHDTIKEVSNQFNRLIKLHLKDTPAALKEADKIILSMQKDADVDVDFMVEKYTREIVGLEV